MRKKFLFLIVFFLILIFLNIISATLNVSLSDQGTDVKDKSTGNILTSGDLSITIYDALSGGNLIYNETFIGAIVNGSWNVMLGENPSNPLSLEFGKIYYKDYAINDYDLDFIDFQGNTVERQFFYSPLGNIAGEDISESANLTISGLNISEGNITNVNTGFFTYLGSLVNRISKLFVIDVNASGNVDVGGDVNASGNVDVGGDLNVTGKIYGDASVLNVNNSNYLDDYDSSFFMPRNKSIYGSFNFNGGWTSNGLSIIGGDIFAQTGYFYNITSLEVSNLSINGSLYPYFDDTFDIGSASLRWKDIYLSEELHSSGIGINYFMGNVGIGTATPGEELEVAGDINSTGGDICITSGDCLSDIATVIPSGAILMFNSSCPTGYTRVTALDDKFPRGSASYGSTGGSDDAIVVTHDHTFTGDALATHGHTDNFAFSGNALGNHGHSDTFAFSGSALGTHSHTFTGSAMGTHGHSDSFAFSGSVMSNHGHGDNFGFSGSAMSNHGHGDNFGFSGSALSGHLHSITYTDTICGSGQGRTYSFSRLKNAVCSGTLPTTPTWGNSYTMSSVSAGTPAGSITGAVTAGSAGTPTGSITGAVTAGSAGTPTGSITGAVTAGSAGTPAGSINGVSAGTPAGSITGAVTAASAGTPTGSVTGGVTAASAGTPAGTISTEGASGTGANVPAYVTVVFCIKN